MKNEKRQLQMKNRKTTATWFHATFYFFVVVFSFSFFLFNYTAAHASVIIQRPLYIGLTSGLVGYWSFDGADMNRTKAVDLSGQNLHGTLTGGATSTIGRIGQGLLFDGTDDFVNVGNAGSGIKTVSFWMKAADVTSRKLVNIDGTDQIETNGSDQVVGTSFPTVTTVYVDGAAAPTVKDGQWHHVVVVTTDSSGVAGTTFEIGRVSSTYFPGTIDDVRIYNRALSADEIKRLYKIGGTFVVNRTLGSSGEDLVLAEGLMGHWTFDGADMMASSSGSAAADRSGKGNLAFLQPNSSSAAGTTTLTYATVGTSTLEVPAGVTQVTVKAWGAGGGEAEAGGNTNADGGGGGGGGYARGDIPVTAGDTLAILVGEGGPGGGDTSSSTNAGLGGEGGGFSGVWNNSTNSYRIIAGGGGGGGSGGSGNGETGGGGGGGGGAAGANGVAGSDTAGGTGDFGDGALTTAAGAGGSLGSSGTDGLSGVSTNGGGGGSVATTIFNANGGANGGSAGSSNGGGGGGGGGAWGGGGGENGVSEGAGGGGGGSGSTTALTNVTTAQGTAGTATAGGGAAANTEENYASPAGKGGTNDTGADDDGSEGNDGRVILAYSSTVATTGNPPKRSIGKLGQALEFDGTDDYVNTAETGVGSGIQTISFWMKANDVTSRKLINIDGTDQIETNASDQVVGTSFPGTTVVYVDGAKSSVVRDGQWHHVVVTDTVGVNGTNFEIGRVSSTYFPGQIDDVRIYSRVLPQSEIQRLYKMGGTFLVNKAKANSTLSEGLVGYWSFDGADMNATRAVDRSGQGNDGTLTNGPTRTIGKLGQALSFDGGDDYIISSNPIGATAATVCSWVYISTMPASAGVVVNNGFLSLAVQNFNSRFLFSSDNGGNNIVAATNSVIINTWTHVCGQRDASGIGRIYLNGIVSGTDNQNSGTPVSGSNMVFGINSDLSSSALPGLLDDVRIYNRALSADEIKRLYNVGR